jgi:hypothetical protein
VSPEGALGPPVPMASLPAASRGVGMPHLVRSGAHLYAAWTSPENGGVQGARLAVEALR